MVSDDDRQFATTEQDTGTSSVTADGTGHRLVMRKSHASADDQAEGLFSFQSMRRFITGYNDYVEETLRPTESRIREILDQWCSPGYWRKLVSRTGTPDPSPVQRTRTRIKEPQAVVRKILAKPDVFPRGMSRISYKTMCDALGVRVVVFFLSALPVIDREIRQSGLFEISAHKPPVAYLPKATCENLGLEMQHESKPSGYASVHYILRLRKDVSPVGHRPWFELQVRTMAQNMWAEVEHLLGYKHRITSPEVRGQFQLIARLLGTIDDYFDMLRSELAERQAKTSYRDEELLDADNLPGVLAEAGLSCSQYDIKGLLKTAAGCGITTVGGLRSVVIPGNVESLTRAGVEALGREPLGSELVLALLLLCGHRPATDREAALRNWAVFQQLIRNI